MNHKLSILVVIVFVGSLFMLVESSYAQITSDVSPAPSVSIAPPLDAQKDTREHSDYVLAYPGLLPDNPLYTLKTFRDKMISFFISSPLKKAEFDLLQSDKRINAAVYLAANHDTSKESLVITTISKAENYYEEGITQMKQAKQEGTGVNDMAGTYKQAAYKYEEVLEIIEEKANGDFKKQLMTNQERIKTLSVRASSLSSK